MNPQWNTHGLLAGRGLVKKYGSHYALAGVDIDIAPGAMVAIVGPSGSGKTSLLHILAGIVRADAGEVYLAGQRIDKLSEKKRSEMRRREFGFVFQSGMLVGELTAEENVALPMLLDGTPRGKALDAARHWLGRLGLASKAGNRPGELSGGQAQRVAIARALTGRPKVIFADEPTGALDLATGREVLGLLREAVDDLGTTIVMVTHDPAAAGWADRVVFLADGRVVTELRSPSAEKVAARMTAVSAR
jgi:putative ABC transport system ATP-binding protein